jgi:hypothetical protein
LAMRITAAIGRSTIQFHPANYYISQYLNFFPFPLKFGEKK